MLDLALPADIPRLGVVACALYREGQRVRDIAVEEIGAIAGRDGGIVWLGLHEPDEALLGTIQSQLGLHELMIEDANQAHQRAKLDIYDNVLFIVLRTAQLDSKGLIRYGETHLIVGKGFVVSIRHGASASYAEVPIIDKISEELEAIEEDIFSATPARETRRSSTCASG
jgi:magnesium transporter